jgi:uncharacterized protein
MEMRCRSVVWLTVALAALVLTSTVLAAAGGPSFPSPPAPGRFITDTAGLVSSGDAAEIARLANGLLTEQRYPVAVVTIRSLAAQGAGGYSIDRYAAELLQSWRQDEAMRTYGMLLVVAADDRQARIQLGSAWGTAHDERARAIMQRLILPAFRKGDLSRGIANGVRGFDAMGRRLELPSDGPWWMPPAISAISLDLLGEPWWALPALLGGALVVLVGLVAIARKGRKSWAWAAAAFIVGLILSRILGGGSAEASEAGGGATGEW